MIDADAKAVLERQRYRIVGSHSAVKLCTWTKKSLMGKGSCYKQQFYGIQSHRCLQMTPAVSWCTHRCIFCWRNVEHTLNSDMPGRDDPGEIVGRSIEAQRLLLTGYGGVPGRVDEKKLAEALKPNQAAISLAGEPTMYPEIGALINEYKKRGFTTFMVTNGTLPDRIRGLSSLPTQLYVSLVAPDEKTYKRTCNPILKDGWGRIMATLSLFPSLDTKKAVRITAVKGYNMHGLEDYARMIGRAEPDYVEVKAYMFVGGSRMRLSLDNMPSNPEVMDFAQKLSAELGYRIADRKADSRVVLLSKS